MDLDPTQARTLDAVVTHGTLEAAARVLHVTPSAVSQRLKALEAATGRVLLVRSKPVRVTEPGEAVLRLARQLVGLSDQVARELGPYGDGPAPPPVVPVAVNADSLGTWVLPALAPLAGEVCFALHRADQEHTADLLRDGTVMAAVTTAAQPVAGCRSTRLGAMTYRPRASVAHAARWHPRGATAASLATSPVVVFDRHDTLQARHLAAAGVEDGTGDRPPTHLVPSTADFLAAVRLGWGWGMLPDLQADGLDDLVELDPHGAVQVELHWQRWSLPSPALDRVTDAVVAAGRRVLGG